MQGIIINISASCVRYNQGVSGTVIIQRNTRTEIERSEVEYIVDLDCGVISLIPKICFRQSDASLSVEAVRDALHERCIDAETFTVVLMSSRTPK